MKDNYSSPFAVALKEAGVVNNTNSKGKSNNMPDFGFYHNIKAIDHTKIDSEDFINISVDGKTVTGKILAMEYIDFFKGDKNKINQFNHPVFGRFITIQNFIAYLRSKTDDESLRTMHYRELLPYMYSNPDLFHSYVVNEVALIAYAIWYRINKNSFYRNLVMESTLPFDSYRTVRKTTVINGLETELTKYVHTPRSSFIIMVATTIRNHLQNNPNETYDTISDPDFEFLRDYKEGDIYAPYAIMEPVKKEIPLDENGDINGNVMPDNLDGAEALEKEIRESEEKVLHTEPDTGEDFNESDVENAIKSELDSDPVESK